MEETAAESGFLLIFTDMTAADDKKRRMETA
jgi:hypothetical protein